MFQASVAAILLAGLARPADTGAVIRRTFVEPWIAAIRSKDPEKVKRFFHPKVLGCINEGRRDFFDYLFKHEADVSLSGGYRVTKLGPLQGLPPVFGSADSFTYPIQPWASA